MTNETIDSTSKKRLAAEIRNGDGEDIKIVSSRPTKKHKVDGLELTSHAVKSAHEPSTKLSTRYKVKVGKIEPNDKDESISPERTGNTGMAVLPAVPQNLDCGQGIRGTSLPVIETSHSTQASEMSTSRDTPNLPPRQAKSSGNTIKEEPTTQKVQSVPNQGNVNNTERPVGPSSVLRTIARREGQPDIRQISANMNRFGNESRNVNYAAPSTSSLALSPAPRGFVSTSSSAFASEATLIRNALPIRSRPPQGFQLNQQHVGPARDIPCVHGTQVPGEARKLCVECLRIYEANMEAARMQGSYGRSWNNQGDIAPDIDRQAIYSQPQPPISDNSITQRPGPMSMLPYRTGSVPLMGTTTPRIQHSLHNGPPQQPWGTTGSTEPPNNPSSGWSHLHLPIQQQHVDPQNQMHLSQLQVPNLSGTVPLSGMPQTAASAPNLAWLSVKPEPQSTQSLLLDIARTCQAMFPFDTVAYRHGVHPDRIRHILTAIFQREPLVERNRALQGQLAQAERGVGGRMMTKEDLKNYNQKGAWLRYD